MKATKKTIGAVALSAALALGTAVPAFAIPTADQNFDPDAPTLNDEGKWDDAIIQEENKQEYDHDGDAGTAAITSEFYSGEDATTDDSAYTKVWLSAESTQISATIPTQIGVMAKMGGGLFTGPTASAYKITNTNPRNYLYVTGVKAELQGQSGNTWDWTAASMGKTGLDALLAGTTGAPLPAMPTVWAPDGTNAATQKYGAVVANLEYGQLDATDDAGNTIDAAQDKGDILLIGGAAAATPGNHGVQQTIAGGYQLQPNNDAETDAAKQNDKDVLFLKITGATSEIGGGFKVTDVSHLMNITYTVSAKAPTA